MTAMRHAAQWLREAARDHWLPLLVLAAPINWVVYQADTAENAIPMLPLPIVAFVVGLALRPRHVWFVWLGSVVILWLVMGLWGAYSDPGGGETVFSLILEAFVWMYFGVLLPVWLGRFIRNGIAQGRHPDQTSTV